MGSAIDIAQSVRLTDADSNVENDGRDEGYLEDDLCKRAHHAKPDDRDSQGESAAAEKEVDGVAAD